MNLKYLDKMDSLRLRLKPVYEPKETAILRRELKCGQTFIDIGAHVGYYTLLASRLVGEPGIVHAFEPDSENFAILEKNIKAAGCVNVFPMNAAVSTRTGMANLYVNPKNSGDNRLFYPEADWRKVQVETICLDDFFSAYSGRIDFVKCDAQGHEPSILRGAREMLGRFPGMKMLMEYFPLGIRQNGDDPKMFLSEIENLGFKTVYPAPEVINHCLPENGKHCNLFLNREN